MKLVLILEDEKAILELLNKKLPQLKNIDIKISLTEKDFKKQIDKLHSDQNIIFFVNICFKWDPSAKRSEFAGIKRIIKRGLRIQWLRREPVIAYGVLSEEELLNSKLGEIFKNFKDYHLYFDLKRLNELDLSSLIEEVKPIPNDETLKIIINSACLDELTEFLVGIKHDIGKTYKLDNEKERKEVFINNLRQLKTILSDEKIDKSLLNETIELLQKFDKKSCQLIKNNLKLITNVLDNLINSFERGFYAL
jgi:hypothetical protein